MAREVPMLKKYIYLQVQKLQSAKNSLKAGNEDLTKQLLLAKEISETQSLELHKQGLDLDHLKATEKEISAKVGVVRLELAQALEQRALAEQESNAALSELSMVKKACTELEGRLNMEKENCLNLGEKVRQFQSYKGRAACSIHNQGCLD